MKNDRGKTLTLKEVIDKKHGLITLTGSVPDVRRFAYCLEEAISKGQYKQELDELIERVESGSNQDKQITFIASHRIYYEPGMIVYGPNNHDRKFWFPIIKKGYLEAKQLYESGYGT